MGAAPTKPASTQVASTRSVPGAFAAGDVLERLPPLHADNGYSQYSRASSERTSIRGDWAYDAGAEDDQWAPMKDAGAAAWDRGLGERVASPRAGSAPGPFADETLHGPQGGVLALGPRAHRPEWAHLLAEATALGEPTPVAGDGDGSSTAALRRDVVTLLAWGDAAAPAELLTLPRCRQMLLYIGGGGPDFVAERAALAEDVAPFLRLLAAAAGIAFAAVDPRSGGVPEQSTAAHASAALAELSRCRNARLCPGAPAVALLLGDRYGPRPLPEVLPPAEMAALKSLLPVGSPARAALGRVYELDTNALQPSPGPTPSLVAPVVPAMAPVSPTPPPMTAVQPVGPGHVKRGVSFAEPPPPREPRSVRAAAAAAAVGGLYCIRPRPGVIPLAAWHAAVVAPLHAALRSAVIAAEADADGSRGAVTTLPPSSSPTLAVWSASSRALVEQEVRVGILADTGAAPAATAVDTCAAVVGTPAGVVAAAAAVRVMSMAGPRSFACLIKRRIEGIELGDPAAGSYVDLAPAGNALSGAPPLPPFADPESQTDVDGLRDVRLRSAVNRDLVVEETVAWAPEGITPHHHRRYLRALADKVAGAVSKAMMAAVAASPQCPRLWGTGTPPSGCLSTVTADITADVAAHWAHAASLSSGAGGVAAACAVAAMAESEDTDDDAAAVAAAAAAAVEPLVSRSPIIARLVGHLCGGSDPNPGVPLVIVVGAAGGGVSAVVAACARRAAHPPSGPWVLYRCCGVPGARSARSLLQGLIWQLCLLLDHGEDGDGGESITAPRLGLPPAAPDATAAAGVLRELLSTACDRHRERGVALVVDGLDRLDHWESPDEWPPQAAPHVTGALHAQSEGLTPVSLSSVPGSQSSSGRHSMGGGRGGGSLHVGASSSSLAVPPTPLRPPTWLVALLAPPFPPGLRLVLSVSSDGAPTTAGPMGAPPAAGGPSGERSGASSGQWGAAGGVGDGRIGMKSGESGGSGHRMRGGGGGAAGVTLAMLMPFAAAAAAAAPPPPPSCVIHMPLLSITSGPELSARWLWAAGRTVSPPQAQALASAWADSPLPVAARVAAAAARRWHVSSEPCAAPEGGGDDGRHGVQAGVVPLGGVLGEACDGYWASLERLHGRVIVARTAAWLCVARDGLSRAEVMDLWCLDAAVRTEAATMDKLGTAGTAGGARGGSPPVPSLLLALLLVDAADALAEAPGGGAGSRKTGGAALLRFVHAPLRAAAARRYLKPSSLAETAGRLADYFSGRLAPPPGAGLELPPQPWRHGHAAPERAGDASGALPDCGPVNYRRLVEYPHALLAAGASRGHELAAFLDDPAAAGAYNTGWPLGEGAVMLAGLKAAATAAAGGGRLSLVHVLSP